MIKHSTAAMLAALSVNLAPIATHAQTSPSTSEVAPQTQFWIQLEAVSNLKEANNRVRAYASRLEHVNGFRVGKRWYGVVLGPYSEQAANSQLQQLKASDLIPGDSYITTSDVLRQQFWPIGANVIEQPPITIETPTPTTVEPATADAPADQETSPDVQPEETKKEALKAERRLDRDARKALQVALKWGDYYTSTIDGAFGPGTRRSMAAWQTDKGYDPTGVLTTRQRQELLDGYQAIIASLGMESYHNDDAGIAMNIPAAMLAFDRNEAPFIHFKAINDSDVELHLISQTGNQDTLFGLYDVMQTLEIVPLNGPRKRKKSSFIIQGSDDKITSYTEVKLIDQTIKGFTLTWPVGDDKRRDMALRDMKSSFASLGTHALPDSAGLDVAQQSIDLLSGLEIRTPKMSRSGFYIDKKGSIVTLAQAVENCSKITIDGNYEADISATDDALGLAVLKPKTPQAPISFATFLTTPARLASDVTLAGYSFEGRLSAPSLTFGQLAELTDLYGKDTVSRLSLPALPGDAGGPVFDAGGATVGIFLFKQNPDNRQLPDDVHFALNAATTQDFLSKNGVSVATTDTSAIMDPTDLGAHAADMTVLVSCWE